MPHLPSRFAMLLAAMCALALPALAAPQPAVTEADLARVVGENWSGQLTYRDYSPPFGTVALAVNANVVQTATGLRLSLQYPREPLANSSDMLSVSEAGRKLGGDPVVSREEVAGAVVITTRAPCEDDGREAICERTYTFGDKVFSWRKSVRLVGGSGKFERNAFAFTR